MLFDYLKIAGISVLVALALGFAAGVGYYLAGLIL
jgi:hypothetical protein